MLKIRKPKAKSSKENTARPTEMERPVNLPITLPSALKPAQPPKGSKWDWAHSFSNVELSASEMPSQGSNNAGKLTGHDLDNDRPVNQKITLPSALKPAKPPKGSKWYNRPDPSIRERAED